jgi:hypothetical protein
MQHQRKIIGGLGNLMFKEAFLYTLLRDGVIPDLYLQDEKYFEKYKDEIKDRFGTEIGFVPHVAIHVRRGDYVGSSFHADLLKTDYYDRAMALFPGKKFLIFSDDIEWCKENFKPQVDLVYVEGNDEVEDFNMMASCESIIMANSTFSWWAAYLNPNFNRRVIAPKEDTWFTDGVIRITMPKEYEQI